MAQIKTYDNEGISHIPLELAKETLGDRDHGVLEKISEFKFKLYGEWHFDYIEAIIVVVLHEMIAKGLPSDFVIVPTPTAEIIPHLEESSGEYVSRSKGGRVWIDYDNGYIWTISSLVGLHKLIVNTIEDDAIGLSVD